MELDEIVKLIGGGLIAVLFIVYFAQNEREKIIEWLKLASAEAEKQLGGGTGKLKLRAVWDRFVSRFPVAAALLPFSVFSAWVDEALKTLDRWLENNRHIESYVREGKNDL